MKFFTFSGLVRTSALRTALIFHSAIVITLAGSLSARAAESEETAATPLDTLIEAARAGVLGTRAPAFHLETLDGETIDLADLYGKKAIYLKFWATWCIPCREQMPHFENVYQNAGDDLAVIAINTGFNDTLEDIEDFREDYDIHMPIVVDDGTLASTFNLRVTPQHIVIGKDGTIEYIGQQADEELDEALRKARTAPARQVTEYGSLEDTGPQFDVGDLLPAETLTTSDGNSFVLQDAAGQVGTVLVFMIPWCEEYLETTRATASESCRQVREQVETLKQQSGNVRWLGINSGLWTLPSDLDSYQERYKTTLPMALDADSHLLRAFGVMTAPTVIVADASGRIINRFEGHNPALETVLSELAKQ